MEVQEQNKIVNISKFVGYNYECYINPNYLSRIFKSKYDANYVIDVAGQVISLYNVESKEQLNKFLDYIYAR